LAGLHPAIVKHFGFSNFYLFIINFSKKMPKTNVARESLLERPLQRKSLLTILVILIVVVLGMMEQMC
jgi:hypothetical protein